MKPRLRRPPKKTTPRKIHVYPSYGQEHTYDVECWCSPYLDFKAPETGNEVWVHRDHN